ncbi:MAG: hypothetical protein Q7R35_10020 [Elusimicrobiota bacterium]|nr:hypothetical protein [Elusimicrobiota bacterium]
MFEAVGVCLKLGNLYQFEKQKKYSEAISATRQTLVGLFCYYISAGSVAILREADQSDQERPSKDEICARVLKEFGADFREILSGSRERRVSAARAAYFYLAKEKGRISGGEIKKLMFSSGGASRLVARGKALLCLR